MSQRFLAVVWDVDGVLIDSEPLHFDNIASVFRRPTFISWRPSGSAVRPKTASPSRTPRQASQRPRRRAWR